MRFLELFLNKWVQEGLQSASAIAAAWLALHGYMAQDQTQGFIGSTVFLGMLAWSAIEKLYLERKT